MTDKKNMNIIYLTLALLAISCNTLGIEWEKRPVNNGDQIYYLSNGKIYKIDMPDNKKANLIFKSPREQTAERYDINGLTCGPENTLLFHMTHATDLIPDFSKTKEKTIIAMYDLTSKEFYTFVDIENIKTAFPILSPGGDSLVMTAWDNKHKGRFFIIKNLRTGSMIFYDQFISKGVVPKSWSPDSKMLALTGGDAKTKKDQMFFFDLEKKEIKPWLEGLWPLISPSGQLIAYVSPDQRKLLIADRDGNTVQSFDEYLFKDINSWIGEDKVLFTIGHFMYQNHIGIADLKKKKIYVIKVPTDGEINGICYKPNK